MPAGEFHRKYTAAELKSLTWECPRCHGPASPSETFKYDGRAGFGSNAPDLFEVLQVECNKQCSAKPPA